LSIGLQHGHQIRVRAFRERILAQVATMKQYASGSYEAQIGYLRDALSHFRRTEDFLNKAKTKDEDLLFRLKMDGLHAEGYSNLGNN